MTFIVYKLQNNSELDFFYAGDDLAQAVSVAMENFHSTVQVWNKGILIIGAILVSNLTTAESLTNDITRILDS